MLYDGSQGKASAKNHFFQVENECAISLCLAWDGQPMIELIQLAKHINIELQIMSKQMLRLRDDQSFPHLETKNIRLQLEGF